MTARRLRHAFFARTAQEYGAAVVALAHHADDQVETFFLRLFRGAGGEGLGAIKWISPSPADPRYSLIRPLLAASKHDILAYAAEHHLKFREDESNQDHALLRNRVRHELLPLLARDYSPGIYRVTLRAAELVGDDADFVRERAELWLKSKRRPIFLRLHPAMQRAVIRQQLWRLGHTGDFELIEKLRSKTVAVAAGTNSALQCDREGQVTSFKPPAPLNFSPDTEVLDLSEVGGIIEFACVELNWRVVAQKDSSKPIEGKPDQEQFDADKVGRQLLLRHWRAGDRFQPLGSRTPSKLQNQFVNRKIPAARRRQIIVAETPSGELCWVEGLPPGERFKLTAKTSRRLTLTWRHQQPN
jgi:tRNA(Ile)-lysidine synthase